MKKRFIHTLIIVFSIITLGCSDNPVETIVTQNLIVSDIPLHYYAPFGGPGPNIEIFEITSSSDQVLEYAVSNKTIWAELFNAEQRLFGETPDQISLQIKVTVPQTLDFGTYYDTIAITNTTMSQDTIFKEIILHIGTEIAVTPTSLEFIGHVNGPTHPSKSLTINSTSSFQFDVAISHASSWLHVPVSSYNTINTSAIQISVNTSGLSKGTYIDTIWIASDTALNSPFPVQVTTLVKPWLPQTSPVNNNIDDLFFSNSQNGWAVGDIIDNNSRSGFIIKTTDGGENWETVKLMFGTDLTDSVLIGVTFVGNDGWVAGYDGIILYSNDLGDNWSLQNHPLDSTINFKDISFISADSGWVVGDSGMILATSDGGLNWQIQDVPRNIDNNFMIHGLTGISFIDNMHGWVCGLTDVILVTSDGGQTWDQQSLPTDSYDFQEIEFVDLLHGWAVGKQGLIVHTTDGGLSWNSQTISGASWLLALYFTDATHGWASDQDGSMFRTIDGVNWTAQTTETTEPLNSIFFIDNDNGWVAGGNGTILHTVSGGE